MPVDVLALGLETKPGSRANRATPALRHMGGCFGLLFLTAKRCRRTEGPVPGARVAH